MAKITISYRRDDSGVIAGRIFDRLITYYGVDTVFRDIDNIPPGMDYRKYINQAIESTDILLAIVGPQWAGKGPDGRGRIHQANDLVRIEVEAALLKDIPVIPVLVASATMPQPEELPDGLQDFAFRNAVKVDALEDFDDHVKRLIRSLDRLLQAAAEAERQRLGGSAERETEERAQQAPAAGPERVRVEPVAAAKLQSEKGGQGPGEQPAGRRSQELPPRPPENVREPVQSAPTAEAIRPKFAIVKLIAIPWRPIETIEQARALSVVGASCLGLYAVLSVVFSIALVYSSTSSDKSLALAFFGLGIVFAGCAVGTRLGSRAAAIGGFILSIPTGLWLVALPLIAGIFASVRGTRASVRLSGSSRGK